MTTGLVPSPDLDDARWLPFDVDLAQGRLQWLQCDEALVYVSTFLDPRMPAQGRLQRLSALEDIAGLTPPAAGLSWVWHTSFCGSTLVAQILHVSPHSVALREPLVLRRLSDAFEAGRDVTPWLSPLLALLARPWQAGGRVVVKPTHAALNIADQAMAAAPASRGIVLTSGLEDFLISNLKKSPETLARIPQLAARALQVGDLGQRLPPEARQPPGPLAAAALQWCAQRELIARLQVQVGDRIRVLDWARIRRDLPDAMVEAAQFLGLDAPAARVREQVEICSRVHAKAPSRPFGVQLVEQEERALRKAYPQELAAAMRWAETHLLPSMSAQALQRPA